MVERLSVNVVLLYRFVSLLYVHQLPFLENERRILALASQKCVVCNPLTIGENIIHDEDSQEAKGG